MSTNARKRPHENEESENSDNAQEKSDDENNSIITLENSDDDSSEDTLENSDHENSDENSDSDENIDHENSDGENSDITQEYSNPIFTFLCGEKHYWKEVTIPMSKLKEHFFILYEQAYKFRKTGCMEMSEVNAKAFKPFLKFVTDKKPLPVSTQHDLLLDILDFAIKYHVEKLQEEIIKTLISATNVNNVLKFYDKSLSIGVKGTLLRNHTFKFIVQNATKLFETEAIFALSDKSFKLFLTSALDEQLYDKVTLLKMMTKWWEAQDVGKNKKQIPQNIVDILHLETLEFEQVLEHINPTAPRFLPHSQIKKLLLDSRPNPKGTGSEIQETNTSVCDDVPLVAACSRSNPTGSKDNQNEGKESTPEKPKAAIFKAKRGKNFPK